MSPFQLLSRPGCHLCEEMLAALAALPEARDVPVEVLDVDRRDEHRIRYGHRIPVLLLDGQPVCQGRLDADQVRRSLADHRRPV